MPCSYNGQSTKIIAILYKGKTAMDVCIGLVRYDNSTEPEIILKNLPLKKLK